MDLSDKAVRDAVTARLAEPYAGRPVLMGPGVLAAYTSMVQWFRDLGCPVLVVATARGAGPIPEPGDCQVVEIVPPAASTMTDEVRQLDADGPPPAAARHRGDRGVRPGAARAAGSPRRSSPTTSRSTADPSRSGGRRRSSPWRTRRSPTRSGRRRGVPHAAYRVVPNEPTALAAGHGRAVRTAGCGVVRRCPRRRQRRRQLRALDPRRRRPAQRRAGSSGRAATGSG